MHIVAWITLIQHDGSTFVDDILLSKTLNVFYCSKRQKDKTSVKQCRHYPSITKYTTEHYNIELKKFIIINYIVNEGMKKKCIRSNQAAHGASSTV